MTRIGAGDAKGRKLRAPTGLDTRPTGARVKQTLFDILAPRLRGARVLDLCAGSGAIGLEALSRGARKVALVDSGRPAVEALCANARLLQGLPGAVEVHAQDARVAVRALAAAGFRFDLVYLDPPYASGLYEELLALLAGVLAEDGVAVAEHFKKRALPETIGGLARTRTVRVGDHVLSFYGPAGREGRE
jgi:16S rRNA (guanine966-N2)-methyltransferase